jgi:L-arabinokinase
MGYRIIADLAGLEVETSELANKVRIADHSWNGFLANITPDEFEEKFASRLPETISGEAFLTNYKGITDPVTSVDPSVTYQVGRATRHPIYENDRVKQFAAILKNWSPISQADKLGELMFQSHESYSSCGLGSVETDLVIDIAKGLKGSGLYGARVTGGGSGGTVAVLGRRGSSEAITELLESYNLKSGSKGSLISGSSPGASAFGNLTLSYSHSR